MSEKTMKCPKCGSKVQRGAIYCPQCMEEIPWVAEYNTVETILTRDKHKKKKRIQQVKNQLAEKHLTNRRRRAVFFCCILVCAVLLGTGGLLYLTNKNNNSYAYQYQRGELAFQKENYDKALEFIDRAITIDSSHEEAFCLLAEVLSSDGDLEGATKVMESCLEAFPKSSIIYGELIKLYETRGETKAIKKILDECKYPEIRGVYTAYITEDPSVDHETGIYSEELEIAISGGAEEFYYTLDGNAPTRKSKKYKAPIAVGEGTTELNVIGYNALGIPSDVIYRKYIVAIKVPDAPAILPKETSFDVDTAITVQVPEGCVGYYAFDEVPTLDSTQYTGPVDMPEGEHTLYAFLVSGNGKASEISSRTYQLTY